MVNDKKICTFTFRNGTKLSAAVLYLDAESNHRSFEDLLQSAKKICWQGDETRGRGQVMSFTVGDHITT